MSEADYLPVNLAYRERWEDENIIPDLFKEEISKHMAILSSSYITGAGGMQTPITELDRCQACKRLAALAHHRSFLEQYKRQQLIGNARLMAILHPLLIDSSDVLRYWVALLYVQLTVKNPACCNLLLESGGVRSVVAVLSLGEHQRIKQDKCGVAQKSAGTKSKTALERKALGLEEGPVSERTQLACLQVLNNIIEPCPEAIEAIVETERRHVRSSGDDDNLGEGMLMGAITVSSALCRRGKRLEYPLLLSAVTLLQALITSEEARKVMLKANVCVNIRQHWREDTPEGCAAMDIIRMLTAFAVVKLQKQMVGMSPCRFSVAFPGLSMSIRRSAQYLPWVLMPSCRDLLPYLHAHIRTYIHAHIQTYTHAQTHTPARAPQPQMVPLSSREQAAAPPQRLPGARCQALGVQSLQKVRQIVEKNQGVLW